MWVVTAGTDDTFANMSPNWLNWGAKGILSHPHTHLEGEISNPGGLLSDQRISRYNKSVSVTREQECASCSNFEQHKPTTSLFISCCLKCIFTFEWELEWSDRVRREKREAIKDSRSIRDPEWQLAFILCVCAAAAQWAYCAPEQIHCIILSGLRISACFHPNRPGGPPALSQPANQQLISLLEIILIHVL